MIGKALSTPVAHRADTPENTLAGIRKARSKGATVVEVDLTFTKDGYPVLLHDLTVDRTSDGKGRIDGMTLAEVKKLDFGSKFGCVLITCVNNVVRIIINYYTFDTKVSWGTNSNALRSHRTV